MGKKLKIIAGVFALAIVISYFLVNANEKEFNQNQWKDSPLTRYKMSNNIVESKMLLGKTKAEVYSLLGNSKPSNLEGKEHLIYTLGKAPSFFETKAENLVVIFENAKVSKVIHSQE